MNICKHAHPLTHSPHTSTLTHYQLYTVPLPYKILALVHSPVIVLAGVAAPLTGHVSSGNETVAAADQKMPIPTC